MIKSRNFFIAVFHIILQVFASANYKKRKARLNEPFLFQRAFPETRYLPFALPVLEVFPPLFAFADEEPLLVFDDAEDLAVFAAPVVFEDLALPAAPPALLPAAAFFPPPSPSSKPPTASATTLIALSAAPVAAPLRISPAASLTFSKTGDSCFLVDFFGAGFDFAEVEAFDFAGADAFDVDLAAAELFAGVAGLAVDFDFAVDLAGVGLFAVDFDFTGVELFAVVF